MQGIKYLFILITWGCLLSCGNEHLVPSDYVNWVDNSENGLLKTKTINPLKIELLYKPIPYVISNEQRKNDFSKEVYKRREQELDGLQYFTLKIAVIDEMFNITNYNITDNAQQQERLTYFSFAMQKDLKLIIETDTLPCKLYHFERSYDLSPYRTFVLGFEQRKEYKGKDKTLVLEIPYFKTGPIKLNYKAFDLERIPTLKL